MFNKRFFSFPDQHEHAIKPQSVASGSGMPPDKSVIADKPEHPYCVLVVDKSPTVRSIARMCLEGKHMLVFDFTDSDQALAWLEEKVCKPHIILLDVDVPSERWFTVRLYVRSYAAYASTAVIALTRNKSLAWCLKEDRTDAHDSLIKPFFPLQLLDVVQRNLPNIARV